jgi:hypothetical protein
MLRGVTTAAAPVDWMLEGEPFVRYRVLRDLLGEPETSPAVRSARQAMLADPRVARLVETLGAWPGIVLASHKSASQPFHKLTFLADLGLRLGDPGVDDVAAAVAAHQAAEGPFQLPLTILPAYGGSGSETWGWALCDAPLLIYALARLGLADDSRVQSGAEYLAGLVASNGWPCVVSKELGTWRGPGRKADPCPFATLAALKALAEFGAHRDGEACRSGAEALLSLWQASASRHPYQFYMGTDFRKLKAPFVWYDLLHVLEVLTRFPWVAGDPRLRDMVELLASKMDNQGRFAPESVWTWWKGWEFAQRSVPSRWITTLAWRILSRAAPAGS